MCYGGSYLANEGLDGLKKDNVVLIVKYGLATGYKQTECPVGCLFNKKMIETHRILKGI